MDALFRVFEAKTAAQRNRHVGTGTYIMITIQGEGSHFLSKEGWKVLERSTLKRKPEPFKPEYLELDKAV
jgi:hypothetical protein